MIQQFLKMAALAVPAVFSLNAAVLAQDAGNACPVDGCKVTIASTEKDGDEVKIVFDANYMPDLSKNHLHVWWGENFDVKQVSNNAETAYNVKQGDWHPTDLYPEYTTQSAASVTTRGEATTICVSAADRNHDILDPAVFDCVSVADLLN